MNQGGQDSLANKHQVRTPLHAKALIEELDHKQLVVLRDGRKIIGLFRSCDQFGEWKKTCFSLSLFILIFWFLSVLMKMLQKY